MEDKSLNLIIRNMVNQLINEGYTKRSICNVLLGVSQAPRFQKFINDEDNLGYPVLKRIAKSLGYELLLYPVKEDDSEKADEIYQECIDFITESKTNLSDYLDNKILTDKPRKTKRKTIQSNFTDTVDGLLKDLLDNSSDS